MISAHATSEDFGRWAEWARGAKVEAWPVYPYPYP